MQQKKFTTILIAANLLLMATVAFLIGSEWVQANNNAPQTAPQLISYQGLLADDSGNLINGTRDLTVKVFAAESGGAALWEETHADVVFDAGAFAVALGSNTPLPDTLFDTPDRWLEMAVDGATLSPRQQFTSAPYAINADKVDGMDAADLGGMPAGAVVWFEDGAAPDGFTRRPHAMSRDIGAWEKAPDMPDGVEDVACDVWTGAEILCWNDDRFASNLSGASYDVNGESWRLMSTSGAPSMRSSRSAVWAGSEMIVWGGWDASGSTNTGGRYDPAADSWTATSTTNAPTARTGHAAVWTGSEMIVWGGGDASGGRYVPTTDSWTAMSTANAPSVKSDQFVVWMEDALLVWGGRISGSDTYTYTTTGSIYDPATDAWTAISADGAPPELTLTSDVGWIPGYHGTWTGAAFVVMPDTGISAQTLYFYDPVADSWSSEKYSVPGTTYKYNFGDYYKEVWFKTYRTSRDMPFLVANDYLVTGWGIYDLSVKQFLTTEALPEASYAFWTGEKLLIVQHGYSFGSDFDFEVSHHSLDIVSPYTKD
jgi:hypothetical protein